MVRQVFTVAYAPVSGSLLRNGIMKKTWKVWALWLTAASMVTAQADNEKSVTAAQVNGTWKTK
jgi:hypothetical protein